MVKLDKIIGVIFDINGTMIFDGKYHVEAWSKYIEELTGIRVGARAKKEHISGKSGKAILEHFMGCEISAEMAEQLCEEKEIIYRKLVSKDKIELVKGLPEFLDYLDKYDIPRTMATSANLSNVMYYFETFDLYRWFNPDKLACNDKKLRDKPYPDLYLVACKLLDIPPEKCLVFEDSEAGILSAINAGVKNIVAVTGDSDGLDIDNLKYIKACIKDFTELRDELEIKNM